MVQEADINKEQVSDARCSLVDLFVKLAKRKGRIRPQTRSGLQLQSLRLWALGCRFGVWELWLSAQGVDS